MLVQYSIQQNNGIPMLWIYLTAHPTITVYKNINFTHMHCKQNLPKNSFLYFRKPESKQNHYRTNQLYM